MKKVFLPVFVVVLFIASTVFAADATKIGFIDLQRALLESNAGKKARADLEVLEKSKKTVIDEKVKAINKVEEELTKQASALSSDARKTKEEELERHKRDLQRLVEDARVEIQKKEAELTEAILKDMSDVVEEFAKEEGYTVIFRSEVLLYAKKDVDITEVVVKKFNESKGKTSESRRSEKEETKERSKEKSKGKK
jgi:outer membrane protein